MVVYTPRHEEKTGANLTGSDGEQNRTYVLQNEDAIVANMQVVVARAILQYSEDFTLDTGTNTITFLNEVWNDQVITFDYFTESTTETTGTAYTTTEEIARIAGIGVEVFGENLGTGDGAEDSYDLEFGNVVADTYAFYYGASGSNDTNLLIETTDYTIEKDRGTVLLTAGGVTKVNGSVIYADYMYSPKQSDTILNSYLLKATAEVDKLTGNYWGSATTDTEYFDGYSDGYPRTDRPFGNDLDDYEYPEFELKYQGIISVTPVLFLNFDGTTSQTPQSTNYQFDEDGRVIFNTSIPNGKRNIKITYSHGYTEVPVLVQELASLIGGMMALVNISGGSYKDVSTYQIGRKSFSIGQIYVNVQESIKQMKARIEEITGHLGYRYALA